MYTNIYIYIYIYLIQLQFQCTHVVFPYTCVISHINTFYHKYEEFMIHTIKCNAGRLRGWKICCNKCQRRPI